MSPHHRPPHPGDDSAVRIEKHPPERRNRRYRIVTAATGSCCCCCLHTIGGLLGAAAGSIPVRASQERPDDDFEPPERSLAPGPWTEAPKAGEGHPDGVVRSEDRDAVSPEPRPAERLPAPDDGYSRYYHRLQLMRDPAGVRAVAIYWGTLIVLVLAVMAYSAFDTSGRLLGTNPKVGLFWLLIWGPAVQLAASVLAAIAVAITGGGGTGLRQVGKITLWTVAGTVMGIILTFGCLRLI